MSKTTKRKHVTKEILEDFYEPNEDEQIVQIIAARGNNLHEVRTVNNEKFLVSMPNKYRKSVWVKRGDYVVIQSIKEGNKVQGEIVSILYPKQLKYLKQKNMWPGEFKNENTLEETNQNESICLKLVSEKYANDGSEEYDCAIFENPNHRTNHVYDDEEVTSSESEKSSCEDETENGKMNDVDCYRVDET